jgi:hypothetical protein
MSDERYMSAAERSAYANGYEDGNDDAIKRVAYLIAISTLSEALQIEISEIIFPRRKEGK